MESIKSSHRRAGFLLASSNIIKVKCNYVVLEIKVNSLNPLEIFTQRSKRFKLQQKYFINFPYITTKAQ